jgi:Flp pilus assembly protein TadG
VTGRLQSICARLGRFGAALRVDVSGGVVLVAALALPTLVVISVAAIDLSALASDKSAMQNAADAAALAAAKQLSVANAAGVEARAKSRAAAQLVDVAERVQLTYGVEIGADRSNVRVTIDGHRQAYFANLLPPGGFNIHAEATAEPLSRMPLCVLNSSTLQTPIKLKDSAQIMAPGCLVHSNTDIAVEGSASLNAGTVQAVGEAKGVIAPAPQEGAPEIADPFAEMPIVTPVGCQPLDLLVDIGIQILAPGVHCGSIKAAKYATLTLLPGEHYFMQGRLELAEHSTLWGDNVALIFDKSSSLKFGDDSTIDLTGRRSGKMEGFVIATTKLNANTFEISSSAARRLLGTIYIPSARLLVAGNNRIADQSAWTVIVAEGIEIQGASNLVINHDYASSSVPVPKGVGPGTGVKLVH